MLRIPLPEYADRPLALPGKYAESAQQMCEGAERRGDRGLWSERGGVAVREGFTAFLPRGTRLMACLKMAGDPPAAQVSKDARKGSHAPSRVERRDKGTKETKGLKGRASLKSCGGAVPFKTIGVKRTTLLT